MPNKEVLPSQSGDQERITKYMQAYEALQQIQDIDPEKITTFNDVIEQGLVDLGTHFAAIAQQLGEHSDGDGSYQAEGKKYHILTQDSRGKYTNVRATMDGSDPYSPRYTANFRGTTDQAINQGYVFDIRYSQASSNCLVAEDHTTNKNIFFVASPKCVDPKEHQGYARIMKSISSIMLSELPTPISLYL